MRLCIRKYKDKTLQLQLVASQGWDLSLVTNIHDNKYIELTYKNYKKKRLYIEYW